MKRLLGILICLLTTGSVSMLYAQEKAYAAVYGSFSLPAGDFGKTLGVNPHVTRRDGFDVGDNAGFAANGAAVSFDFSVPVGVKGLTWVSGIHLVINGSDDSALTERFRQLLGDTVDVQFDYGTWIQLPVMTGFKFSFPLMKQIEIYGMAQGGISLIQPAKRKASVSGTVVDERNYDLGRAFGYGFGGGVVVNNRVDLSARFFDFGTPKFDGTRMLSEAFFSGSFDIIGEDVILGQEIPVSMVLFSLGYRL